MQYFVTKILIRKVYRTEPINLFPDPIVLMKI